jgi:hypothetical protein
MSCFMYFLYFLHKVENYINVYNKTCTLFLYSFVFYAICAVFMLVCCILQKPLIGRISDIVRIRACGFTFVVFRRREATMMK